MRNLWLPVAAVLVAACGGASDSSSSASSASSTSGALDAVHGQADPPMRGIVWARGAKAKPGGGSPDLVYHGGPVMASGAYVEAIFWGAGFGTDTQDKIGWMQTFYSGLGGSKYDGTNGEYTQTDGQHVGSGVTWGGSHLDTSPAPNSGNRTSAILAEVCSTIGTPVANGFYPVYIDQPRHGSYCAYHSVGTCNGVTVQFAFFYDLDGDAGCDPQSPSTDYSQGVAALGNVTGHEISEALTDPHLDAWYDQNGAENADKCAWTFGASLLPLRNRSTWKVQGNWSNAAYDANQGYTDPSAGFVRGCIDGTN